jgi:hypothetical protein
MTAILRNMRGTVANVSDLDYFLVTGRCRCRRTAKKRPDCADQSDESYFHASILRSSPSCISRLFITLRVCCLLLLAELRR